MKTPFLTICALAALATFANAQQQNPNADPKKDQTTAQAPSVGGTFNGGDVDRTAPKVDHGTQKTAPQAKDSNGLSSKPTDNGSGVTNPDTSKTNSADKDQSKATNGDHGTEKTTHPDPKDGTDPSKDAKTEDKSKNDKITDHEHGAEKTKN